MSKPAYRKELRKPIKAATAAGWTLDYTKGDSHPRLSPPRGLTGADGTLVAPVTFNSTGGNGRRKGGDNNSLAALKRAGVEW